MEFKDFWKQKQRMCKNKGVCCPSGGKDCPMTKLGTSINVFACAEVIEKHPIEAEQIVEQWAKEHPIVTNEDKFKEVFGDVIKDLYTSGVVTEDVDIYISKWLEREYEKQEKEDFD